jgi:hypothetical protein
VGRGFEACHLKSMHSTTAASQCLTGLHAARSLHIATAAFPQPNYASFRQQRVLYASLFGTVDTQFILLRAALYGVHNVFSTCHVRGVYAMTPTVRQRIRRHSHDAVKNVHCIEKGEHEQNANTQLETFDCV